MHGSQSDIDELYSDEGKNHAANAPDEQVPAQQSIGAERLVLDTFQSNRNQGRNDQGALKMTADNIADVGE
jgi:hypothetical protein